MSNIGSLGIDSTLRYFMHETKCCHRVLVPPSSDIDCPVLHQEASLQKKCDLEISQAVNKLIIISHCIPTTSAILLYN